MKEISIEEQKEKLHNRLKAYISERRYRFEAPYLSRVDVEFILSDIDKLEKIEQILIECEEYYDDTCHALERIKQIIKGQFESETII